MRPSRSPAPLFLPRLFAHRFGGVLIFILLNLWIALATRIALLISSRSVVDWNLTRLMEVFCWGLVYDLAATAYLMIPMVIVLMVLPEKIFAGRFHRRLSATVFLGAIYALLFGAAAEWFFWKEFGSRFNFIAVDYLVYTTEVLRSIRESYPMPLVLGILFILCGALSLGLHRAGWFDIWLRSRTPVKNRLICGMGILFIPLLLTLVLNNWMVPGLGNNYNQELARNGLYSLVAAFWHNELDYDQFYRTENDLVAFSEIRKLLRADNATFLSEDPKDLTRYVATMGEAKLYNVIQITVESLSAEYLSAFGSKRNLTPNLDALAEQGILFNRFYATGTRTDRGMESLTLSVPPTPGRSIIKRPNNEHLFTLGSVFQSKGYDTAFLYGGYGYFDNMNYFFGNNGYRTIDRAAVPKEAVTFANAWGACDEDLYRWELTEADRSYAEGKPFFHFVMTTSNHRPYTYPEGRIDIPSHTGRAGAVKYTDFAIGEFLREARDRPWFHDTIFVIVADHCASSAGKTDLSIKGYRIPLILYNPELLPPQRVDALCSQMDYPPTLLGLLNWSYESRFFGKDILRMEPREERALIANYQKLGYMKDGELVVLKPVRQETTYRCNLDSGRLDPTVEDEDLTGQAMAYYQTASHAFRHRPVAHAIIHEAATRPNLQEGKLSRVFMKKKGPRRLLHG